MRHDDGQWRYRRQQVSQVGAGQSHQYDEQVGEGGYHQPVQRAVPREQQPQRKGQQSRVKVVVGAFQFDRQIARREERITQIERRSELPDELRELGIDGRRPGGAAETGRRGASHGGS